MSIFHRKRYLGLPVTCCIVYHHPETPIMFRALRQPFASLSSVTSAVIRPQSRRLAPPIPLVRQPQPRLLHTSLPRRAQYERFPSGGSRYPGPASNSGRSQVWYYLKRRLGGERAVYVYGIALGGGGIYYVAQWVRSQSRSQTYSLCLAVLRESLRQVDCDSWTSAKRQSKR